MVGRIACLISVFAIGCAGSVVEGQASYVKPASEGGPKAAFPNASGELVVRVELEASGTFAPVDAERCDLTSGAFTIETGADTAASPDGSFSSTFNASEAVTRAKSSVCGALSNVVLEKITSVTVNGSMPTNERNCDVFCQAKADDTCSGHEHEAQCMSDVTTTCQAQCAKKTKIHGTGKASASAIAETNKGMDSSGNTTTTVDLVFTRLE